jgi:hypothetical protein
VPSAAGHGGATEAGRQLAVAPKITPQPSLEAVGIKAFTPRFLELLAVRAGGAMPVPANGTSAKPSPSSDVRGVVVINDGDGLDHHGTMKGLALMWAAFAVEGVTSEVVIAGSPQCYPHLVVAVGGNAGVQECLSSADRPCPGA